MDALANAENEDPRGITIPVRDKKTGRVVRLTKEMIQDVYDNGDGTATIVTPFEGSFEVLESSESIRQAIKNFY